MGRFVKANSNASSIIQHNVVIQLSLSSVTTITPVPL